MWRSHSCCEATNAGGECGRATNAEGECAKARMQHSCECRWRMSSTLEFITLNSFRFVVFSAWQLIVRRELHQWRGFACLIH